MKMDMKYQIRRLAATIILLAIFMIFTMSVMVKGIDNNESYQNRVMNNHMEIWEVD